MDENILNKDGHYSIYQMPWSNLSEFKTCYDLLFNNKYDKNNNQLKKIEESVDSFIFNLDLNNLKIGVDILSIWNARKDHQTFVLPSLLLTESVIDIIEKTIAPNKHSISLYVHNLGQKIIRVTNLIIDDLKKKNRSIAGNMFLVAKKIDLPEFIIEIRHACTHKQLPTEYTLEFAIKYLFYWIKENFWDKQYSLMTKEEETKNKILNALDNISGKGFNKIINQLSDFDGKLEVNSLYEIVDKFFAVLMTKLKLGNNKKIELTDTVDGLVKVFKTLQNIEGKLIPLLMYHFISQQISKFLKVLLKYATNNENFNLPSFISQYDFQLKSLAFIAKFIFKYDVIKDKQRNSELFMLMRGIYNNLKFAKDFSPIMGEIFDTFILNVKDFDMEEKKITYPIDKEVRESSIDYQTKSSPGSLLFIQLNNLKSNDIKSEKQTNDETIATSIQDISEMIVGNDEDYETYNVLNL